MSDRRPARQEEEAVEGGYPARAGTRRPASPSAPTHLGGSSSATAAANFKRPRTQLPPESGYPPLPPAQSRPGHGGLGWHGPSGTTRQPHHQYPPMFAPPPPPPGLAGLARAPARGLDDVNERIEQARARLQRERAAAPQLHPSLLGLASGTAPESAPAGDTPAGTVPDAGPARVPKPLLFATTKANQRIALEAKQQRQQQTTQVTPAAPKELVVERDPSLDWVDPAANPYFDPNLHGLVVGAHIQSKRREQRALRFVQPGRYIAQANQQRMEERIERLKEEIAAAVQQTGLQAELELVADTALHREPPPSMEWWDVPLCVGATYAGANVHVVGPDGEPLLSNLIQHPVPIPPPLPPSLANPAPRPLMLTEKERKKLRRQTRLVAQKDKQDKIRLGILPPDPPKMKISNLMRILGKEAVQDPTQMEALVRKQIKERQDKHQATIDASRLTVEQRREKKREKLMENTENLVHVAVFRIKKLTHPSHRFKVDQNAKQHNLSGAALLYSGGMNVVVVEGGPKGIKFYKRLMLHRIDWCCRQEGDADLADNECVLVWEGSIRERLFPGPFRFRPCPTEEAAKEVLERCNAVHYWHAARNWVGGMTI